MSEGNEKNPKRIGIIGLGPVGGTLAVHLKEAGAFVAACDIFPNIMDRIKSDGIKLVSLIEKKTEVDAVCYTVQELGAYNLDLIIIAVKAPALTKIISQLKEIDNGKFNIMVAQNGIDNEVDVARAFGDDRTLRMVINFAGSMADENTVHVSFFNPPNYIASLLASGDTVANNFAEMLNIAGLETKVPEDIQDFVWQKAILNSSLSAICAVSRRTMKDVMDFPQTLELVEGIIDESVRVAEMEKIDLGPKFRRFSIRYLKSAGHHRPSMLVDLENGRPTEIDRLNGKIVEYGRKHYLPTPLNQSVTALVHFLEDKQN